MRCKHDSSKLCGYTVCITENWVYPVFKKIKQTQLCKEGVKKVMPKPYGEITGGRSGDFEAPLLASIFMDEEFEIEGVRFREGELGAYAMVKVDGTEYRTASQVLLDQLKKINNYIEENGDTVVVTLTQKKRYYTFQ